MHNSKLSKFDRIGLLLCEVVLRYVARVSPYGLLVLLRSRLRRIERLHSDTAISVAGKLSLCGNHINIVRPDFHLRVSVILKEQLSI